MADLDLDALEAVAREANEGPWYTRNMIDVYSLPLAASSTGEDQDDTICQTLESQDAEHIAAFDPPTVLALIARLREAEAVIEAVRQMLPRPMSEPLSRDFTGRPFPRIIDGDTVAAILSRYKPTTENESESD